MKHGEDVPDCVAEKTQATKGERFDENILVISAARNIVVLPYSVKELQKVLPNEPDCADLRELVDKKYTVPLSRYKHKCISRFKEAFTLVREREKSSALKAFDLATEVFFTRYLHPAVITACKSRDWLDVYLDCLDKNELDEFPFFGIRFEPKIPENKRKSTEK